MVILHVAGLSGNKSAGPTMTVPKNVEYGSKYENVALYNCSNSRLDNLLTFNKYFSINEFNSISSLPPPFNKPDIVIFHSMYIKKFIDIYNEIQKKNIPYIIVPRGALTKLAQNKKKAKKAIGNLLFFNKFVKNANAINFLTENEYIESKQFKFRDYFINGNGIDKKFKHKAFSKKKDKFIVTFIGRIEWYHKGLDFLIDAINLKKDEFKKYNFIFNLYGPDDFNSYKKLESMINNYKISHLIKINGPVFGSDKEKILLNSDLFIHTSRLEGQPTSVMEAISYGVPVLVTPGTNIDKEVKNNKLGYVAKLDSNDIAKKVLLAYNENNNNEEISKNEIDYSNKNFDWDTIVKRNINEYKRIIKKF